MASRRESDFLRLERLLQEAEQARRDADLRTGEERQAREKADVRADEERQAREEADVRADEERQAREEADQLTQNTTLSEYLRACHEHLHKPLGIETDKSLTTTGFTSPQKKLHPEVLRSWEDFPETQNDIFQALHGLFHPSQHPAPRSFDPILGVEISGRNHCHVRLANEWSLRTYQHVALEIPVSNILKCLYDLPEAEEKLMLKLEQGVTFENTPNSLSDEEQEVRDRMQEVRDRIQEGLHIQPPRTPPPPPPPRSRLSPSTPEPTSEAETLVDRTRADQYCVYKNIEGLRDLMLIVEYKPPHKLSAGDLQRGFREMNLKEDFIDRTNIPRLISTVQESFKSEARPATESRKDRYTRKKMEEERDAAIEARLQYNADKLVAAVATQTFHYMIENRLEYSYITTGETFVFLRILAEDPKTLYYHVSVPVDEIDDTAGTWEQHTAVAQVVVFCIMAFQSKRRSHKERANAKLQLKEYPSTNYQTLLLETPESERQIGRQRRVGRKSPSYKGGRKGSLQSDYKLRSGRYPREPPDAGGGDVAGPSNNPSGAAEPDSADRRQQRKEGNDGGKNKASGSGRRTQRQYCTQRCLLGLVRRISVDGDCPNAKTHPARNGKHAIDIDEFMDLIRQQLARHVDYDCEPLGLQGARGALFKIILSSHGYVFVGKGTVHAFVPDLLHEGRIYERLESLQGTAVPVCLGNIDLVHKYYLDLGVRIQHMLLMSWVGTPVKDMSALQAQVQRTVGEVRGKGIDQNDVRSPNLLWNDETQRLMLIDFERAIIIAKRTAMEDISPNKRRNHFGSHAIQNKANGVTRMRSSIHE